MCTVQQLYVRLVVSAKKKKKKKSVHCMWLYGRCTVCVQLSVDLSAER
jgi:hypothetical protein